MRKLPGIRRHGDGWQAYVQPRINGKATFLAETFPRDTPVDVMQAWRTRELRKHAATVPVGGSIADDVRAHVVKPNVARMPTAAQRVATLDRWLDALGRDRTRQSVTSADVQAIADRWLGSATVVPKGQRGRPTAALRAGTVIKRLSHLQSFYADMNAPHESNPVVGVARPAVAPLARRDRDMSVVDRLLGAMPPHRDTADGDPPRPSLSKIRARVLAYTGLPPGVLGALDAHAVSFKAATVTTPTRHKGAGVASRTLPLNADAVAAFRDLHAAGGWGPFSVTALNRCVQRAARKLNVRGFTLYDLRHSYLAHVYRVTKDLATVARLGLHAPGSTVTLRYTLGAHDDVDRDAVAAVAASLVEKRRDGMKAAPTPRTGRA